MARIGILSTDTLYPLVQSSQHPWLITDDLPLIEALQRRHDVQLLSWRALAQGEVLPQLEVVLVRTPWGYMQDAQGFLQALEHIEASSIPLLNPLPTIRWNLDKRYLLDLTAQGLPVIPTRLLQATELDTLPALLQGAGWTEAVLKPSIGAGGEWTYRLSLPTLAARLPELACTPVQTWLVQPFREAILEEGEWSLIFFGGEFSHAVQKVSGGDFRIHEEHGGFTRWDTPVPPGYIRAAQQVLSSLEVLPIYARVDGVASTGQFEVMELELIEPELFFRAAPGAAHHLAQVVEDWLSKRARP